MAMTGIRAIATPATGVSTLAKPRIRRCQYRRIVCVGSDPVAYDVHCLHPALRVALPLGDLAVATSVCDTCTAEGIFRPDED